mmetsp:Transcript_60082/g.131626  ORF Transcript_60082/g.131626 Transcript_60082/m.131626 type:complete len:274 (-) Transcript_60082:204-1025(-)
MTSFSTIFSIGTSLITSFSTSTIFSTILSTGTSLMTSLMTSFSRVLSTGTSLMTTFSTIFSTGTSLMTSFSTSTIFSTILSTGTSFTTSLTTTFSTGTSLITSTIFSPKPSTGTSTIFSTIRSTGTVLTTSFTKGTRFSTVTTLSMGMYLMICRRSSVSTSTTFSGTIKRKSWRFTLSVWTATSTLAQKSFTWALSMCSPSLAPSAPAPSRFLDLERARRLEALRFTFRRALLTGALVEQGSSVSPLLSHGVLAIGISTAGRTNKPWLGGQQK